MSLPKLDSEEDYAKFNQRLNLKEKQSQAISPGKVKGAKLWPIDKQLLENNLIFNVTHNRSSSIWLEAESRFPGEGFQTAYRPMGQPELSYLLEHSTLPNTQPYQAIIVGLTGRLYAEKFLRSSKYVDSEPCSVVEFTLPSTVLEELFQLQHKVEDGALSMGLGHAAGGGLGRFNQSLSAEGSFRIVLIKRRSQ